ncbi:MAG: hypothetical protein RLZZ613_1692 [Pseudomonadota bacterium]
MIFLGIAHTAVGHDGCFARMVSRFSRKILRSVSLGAAGLPLIIKPGSTHRHPMCRLQFHPALSQRMGNGLILANGPIKDHALIGVSLRSSERDSAQAYSLGRNQDTFGI